MTACATRSSDPVEALNPGSTGASQLWTFTANLDDTYRITNKATGLVLSDPPAHETPGKRLVLAPFDGDSNQKWIVTPLDNGYRITNVFTKSTADATTAVPSPGTSIVHATPTGDSEQVWSFGRPADGPALVTFLGNMPQLVQR